MDATQKRSRRLLVVVGMKEAPEGANGEGSSCRGEKSRGAEKKICKKNSRSSRRDSNAVARVQSNESNQGLKQKINRQGEGGEKVRSMSGEVSLEIADGEIQSSETSLCVRELK
ncbi:hypothetical protein RUM44_003650 [Polyplax serrata]|uniref:Uncharacterized protein n=1 Tax=Polyplax serrata TaxID=468196 RepID=A0ABR1AH24_POLSC